MALQQAIRNLPSPMSYYEAKALLSFLEVDLSYYYPNGAYSVNTAEFVKEITQGRTLAEWTTLAEKRGMPKDCMSPGSHDDVERERKNLQEQLRLLREPASDTPEDVRAEIDVTRRLDSLETNCSRDRIVGWLIDQVAGSLPHEEDQDACLAYFLEQQERQAPAG